MKWLSVIEVGLIVLMVTFMATQLLIPSLRGLPLFPVLREKRQKALDKVVAAREEQDVRDILNTTPTVGVAGRVPPQPKPGPTRTRRTRES